MFVKWQTFAFCLKLPLTLVATKLALPAFVFCPFGIGFLLIYAWRPQAEEELRHACLELASVCFICWLMSCLIVPHLLPHRVSSLALLFMMNSRHIRVVWSGVALNIYAHLSAFAALPLDLQLLPCPLPHTHSSWCTIYLCVCGNKTISLLSEQHHKRLRLIINLTLWFFVGQLYCLPSQYFHSYFMKEGVCLKCQIKTVWLKPQSSGHLTARTQVCRVSSYWPSILYFVPSPRLLSFPTPPSVASCKQTKISVRNFIYAPEHGYIL